MRRALIVGIDDYPEVPLSGCVNDARKILSVLSRNEDGTPNYDNVSKTQNGRVSYPIYHINNWHKTQMASHPTNIIFLTCDAFGVLPPVSKLTPQQAMYHFLSGYTAKVAGTERGITEPQATFSACFGEAFLTLHPFKYAELLQEKLETHNVNTYLVNTGWSGGPYGVGERMSIKDTRLCINSILSGDIENSNFIQDKIFQFLVPEELPGVSREICIPSLSWYDRETYYEQARKLAKMFQENYKRYSDGSNVSYSQYGPIIE